VLCLQSFHLLIAQIRRAQTVLEAVVRGPRVHHEVWAELENVFQALHLFLIHEEGAFGRQFDLPVKCIVDSL